jgi:D-glycero-D-manno-heptose 1,7-bisphosphate phosphatase
MMRRPALFLDRDGVINEDVGYLHRPEDCCFIPGIEGLIATANRRGYAVVVVTNQAGIGRGYYDEAAFHHLMNWMRTELAAKGAMMDAVYFCPDHPEHGIGQYKRENPDRKPGPGMLLRAAKDLSLDLAASVLVGDKQTDLLAGKAAGVGRLVYFGADSAQIIPEAEQISQLAEAAAFLRS